jgi:hypothetical protein
MADRGLGWYRGDCHVHSANTVAGGLPPEEITTAARDLGLDFVAATGHNTADDHRAWAPYEDDELLVIPGQEVVTANGHWLALGLRPGQLVDWRYRLGDGVHDARLAEVRDGGGICVAAHPHVPYPSGVLMYPFDGFDVVEVWNGAWASNAPWQADNRAAVAEWGRSVGSGMHSRRWRPAIGNSDTHFTGQLGVPQTVVWADDLTTEAVLAGIRAGRSWIAASSSIDLSVMAHAGGRDAGIGERLVSGGERVRLTVAVGGVPAGTVSLHTAAGPVHRDSLSDGTAATVRWETSAAESAFVRVEVHDADGQMAALSNPIILA